MEGSAFPRSSAFTCDQSFGSKFSHWQTHIERKLPPAASQKAGVPRIRVTMVAEMESFAARKGPFFFGLLWLVRDSTANFRDRVDILTLTGSFSEIESKRREKLQKEMNLRVIVR